jgi:hypothetical protein
MPANVWDSLPVCPFCGHEDHDWWDGLGEKHDGDEWEVCCPNCDQTYTTALYVDYSFLSKAEENKNGDDSKQG